MATLLLELEENRTFNRTLFPAKLFVYNDLLIYTKRHWLSVREVTFAYNQIAQFNLIKGVFFAQIGLVTTGTDDIELKFVNRAKAIQAKKIIDQKVYQAHHINKVEKPEENQVISSYEKSLNRLKELLQKNKITKQEYERERSHLLKKVK